MVNPFLEEMSSLRLTARLGKVVRIAPNEVSISDPKAIAVIYPFRGGLGKVSYPQRKSDVHKADIRQTDFYLPFRPGICKLGCHWQRTQRVDVRQPAIRTTSPP